MLSAIATAIFCFLAFFMTSIAARMICLFVYACRTLIKNQTEKPKELFGGFLVGTFFVIAGAFLNSLPAFICGWFAPALIQKNYNHGIVLLATCIAAIVDASLLIFFREKYGKIKIYARLLISTFILVFSWTLASFFL
ncbi:MAG: hypothetical protein M3R17_16775 [Bacteroidota bacterium]|nr:hypothetical protein [Bacteroidota bacterium]